MFNSLMRRLPTTFLNNVLDAAFFELQLRGEIKVATDESVHQTPYGDYQIRLITERDNTYTTTWEVYQEGVLLCEGEDEFYSSEGEAERSAMEWIEKCRSIQQKCLPR